MTQLPSSHSQDQKADALRYALLLDWGTRIGLISLVISFAAYMFGLLVPHVPLDQLPMVWNQPAGWFQTMGS